jgi:membrane-bound metal-dependent hydrolase YbcI (DUF457 family)
MRGITHLTIGANMVWLPMLFGVDVAPWLVIVPAFTALLPDLDASESYIKHLSVGAYVGHEKVAIRPFVIPALIFSKIFGHRSVLHSIFILAILAALAYVFVPAGYTLYATLAILGYASHLMIDSLTKSGVEAFWPIKRNVGLLPRRFRVKTGGLLDTLLLLAGAGGVVVFLSRYIVQ